MDNVLGVVEAVGNKFSGSLKVNGSYYTFPKSYTGKKDFNVGDNVIITLKQWEYKGKTGFNIGNVEYTTGEAPTPSLNPDINKNVSTPHVPKKSFDSGLSKEEWAAKDTRISRQGVIQAAVQAVASHSSSVQDLEEKAIALADVMLKYVNAKEIK